jgi:hypothetical protein
MTVEDRIREAARETRSAFSGRRHAPITQLANRAAIQRFVAVASGIVVVFATIGLAGWSAFGGSDSAATTPDTPPTTTAATQPGTTNPTAETGPSTTTPETTEPADDGLSDTSAIPEGWRTDFPEDGQFLLLDSGIALAAFPNPESENEWWMSVARAAHLDGMHNFGPDDQGASLAGMPEVLILLAFDDERSEFVVAGLAPANADQVELTFGDATPVTVDRVFQRAEVGRSVFVGSFPYGLLLDQEGLLPVEMSATGADGQEIPTPAMGYQGSTVNDQYTGPITSDLFHILPPLIVDSTTADTPPEVMGCQGGPGVDHVLPNQGREIADGEVLATPMAALEAILAEELADDWYPHSGFVEITLPDNKLAYAVPSETTDGAVVLIELTQIGDGWTVTSWEASGC